MSPEINTHAGGRAPGDGLQPERTALAWSRTSFGVLGNGTLLLVRDLDHYTGTLRLVPAGLAMLIAVLTYLVGARRQRVLRARPLPRPLAARRQVRLIGGSVVMLIVVTALALPS